MSRTACRVAAAVWLGGTLMPRQSGMYRGGPVTMLGTLWSAPPREVHDDDYWPGPGVVSGGVAVVYLAESKELRESFGGGGVGGAIPNGFKRVDYQLIVAVSFHSTQKQSEAAVADFDTHLDSLIARMRADHTWGTGGTATDTIWQAGEDITVKVSEMKYDRQRFYGDANITTAVTEWIQA